MPPVRSTLAYHQGEPENMETYEYYPTIVLLAGGDEC
jgi:hypothetical protein